MASGESLDTPDPRGGGFARAPSEALWESLELGFAGVRPFVEGSLDRWHARSSVGSGASAGKGAFKALNQSVSQQVTAFLADPARAARRAAAPLTSAPRRLVEPRDLPLASASPSADPEGDPRDPESFDDTEFYAQLLKARGCRAGRAHSGAREEESRAPATCI